MLESTNKISKEVQKRVKEIAAMGGDSKKRIDTDAEYKELANLLAGQSGANYKYVKEKMVEYETYVKEQQEKAFLEKVSDAVKKFVSDVAKSFGDENKIDSDEEASRLIKMLPNTNGDLSNEDIEYIHRALAEGGYDVNLMTPPDDKKMSSGDVEKDKTEDISVQPQKHSCEEPTTNEPKTSEPKRSKPVTLKPINKQPKAPSKAKKEAEPKVLERDAIDGTTRGRKFAEESNSLIVNNRELASQLKGVNSKNAYDFFQQYKAENNGRQNIVSKTLVETSDQRKQLDYRNVFAPIKALLLQAESYGLKDNYAYRRLYALFKEIARAIATPDSTMDPSKSQANKIDYAIDSLLFEMGKVVH